jgi:hypothetical protein
MPYVIKSKTADRYVNGSESKAAYASMDEYSLVPLEFARIYPTKNGAKYALDFWAYIMDQRDNKQEMKDTVEIIEVTVTRTVTLNEVK